MGRNHARALAQAGSPQQLQTMHQRSQQPPPQCGGGCAVPCRALGMTERSGAGAAAPWFQPPGAAAWRPAGVRRARRRPGLVHPSSDRVNAVRIRGRRARANVAWGCDYTDGFGVAPFGLRLIGGGGIAVKGRVCYRQLPLRCPSNTRSDGSRWPIEQGARLELMGARWGFLPDCIGPHRAQSAEVTRLS